MTEGASSTSREMPILLGPGTGTSEMLILLGARDESGVVHVRSWTADDWSSPPRVRAERAETLLQWLESQVQSGRTMNQSLYAVRLWLRGEGERAR
ncbi:MAG: hypothetical protein ACJ8AD_20540 [Gemmatimonadaceae bacterium]